jgi:hypothetical protein
MPHHTALCQGAVERIRASLAPYRSFVAPTSPGHFRLLSMAEIAFANGGFPRVAPPSPGPEVERLTRGLVRPTSGHLYASPSEPLRHSIAGRRLRALD